MGIFGYINSNCLYIYSYVCVNGVLMSNAIIIINFFNNLVIYYNLLLWNKNLSIIYSKFTIN